MARVQLTVPAPLMVVTRPMEGALRMGHVVPMVLEVVWVCTSALLVVGDSPHEEVGC
jgi:hypothetical protein